LKIEVISRGVMSEAQTGICTGRHQAAQPLGHKISVVVEIAKVTFDDVISNDRTSAMLVDRG
jgi:hypothetical protein